MIGEDSNALRFANGDRVRIRDWDDMVSEFGISDNIIECDASFVPEMRHLCGREFTVVNATYMEGGFVDYARDVEGFEREDYGTWVITADMLELVDDGCTLDDVDAQEFMGVLSLQ